MIDIKLSYVLTTYNKLPYLKRTLAALILNRREGEEIVVTDGGSTDGTIPFLQELFDQGKIDQLVSEKDFGEAHGFNKGILMAKGELIKLLSDDDVYDFNLLQQCKEYLFKNEAIDVLFTNTASINAQMTPSGLFLEKFYEVWFEEWKSGLTKNCFICCLSIMFRRKSLSYIGLLDTSFKSVDFEFTVRITSRKINVTFCSAIMVCALINADSVSQLGAQFLSKEIERVSSFYDYVYPLGQVSRKKSDSLLRRVVQRLMSSMDRASVDHPSQRLLMRKDLDTTDLGILSDSILEIMRAYNENDKISFSEMMQVPIG